MIPIEFHPSQVTLPVDFIPDHLLIRPIGEGSYGQVWLGRSASGDFRAIKIVFRHRFRSERPFERELAGILTFEPISRSHPGFVDVLHVGCRRAEACFYYSMELADNLRSGGSPLDVEFVPKTLESLFIPGNALSVTRCVELGLGLADALAFLHEHGLVHRDIKPSNVIFVGGVAKFADVGLVADVDETRSFVGTEGFVPPEGPGTPQADIYSLGKLLYELCSGRDRKEFPAIPGGVEDLDEYLEINEILLRACHPETAQRYESARQMHADLKLILDGKSVRRVRRLERQVGRLKRIAHFTIYLAVVTSFVGYSVGRTHRAAEELRQERIGFLTAQGIGAMTRNDVPGALPGLINAAELETSPARSLRDWSRISGLLMGGPRLIGARIVTPLASSVSFDALHDRLLVGGPEAMPEILSAGLEPGDQKTVISTFTGLTAADSKGRFVALGNAVGSIRLLDAFTLKGFWGMEMRSEVYALNFNPDATLLAIACSNRCVRVWDIEQKKEVFRLPHPAAVMDVHFSSDGQKLVTACRDGFARVWTLSGTLTVPPMSHEHWVYSAVFSPDDAFVATASYDRRVRLWNAETGESIGSAGEHLDGARTAAFSPDGHYLVSAGFDSMARVWNVDGVRGLTQESILPHSAKVTSAVFSRDGSQVASVATDGSLRVWDWNPEGRRMSLLDPSTLLSPENTKGVTNILFRSSLSQAFGRTDSGELCLISRRKPLVLPIQAGTNCENLIDCPDRPWVASWTSQKVTFYDAATGASREFSLGEAIEECVFSQKGSYLFVTGKSTVACISMATWSEVFPRIALDACAYRVVGNRDESMFAVCCRDSTLAPRPVLLFTRDGKHFGKALQHRDGVLNAAFSADGKRIVTAGEDFSAIIWEVETGRQIGETLLHHHQVRTAVFSDDGSEIVTTSDGGEVCLWDSTDGLPLGLPWRLERPVARTYFWEDRIVVLDDRGEYWIAGPETRLPHAVAKEWYDLQFSRTLPENFEKRVKMLRPFLKPE